jgi:PTH1 family peptidyl-tRNA hydrolase
MPMKLGGLLVGLGNPGREYENTRHNFGFMLIDELLRREQKKPYVDIRKEHTGKNNYELWKIFFSAPPAPPWLLLKPLTYMNNSGQSVSSVANYYELEPKDILVAHDELDIPLGSMRFKFSGGSAGHKGINSIVEHLGSKDFYRLRMGIGKQPGSETIQHVLGHFTKEDQVIVQKIIEAACHGFRVFHDNKDKTDKALSITQEFINGFSI